MGEDSSKPRDERGPGAWPGMRCVRGQLLYSARWLNRDTTDDSEPSLEDAVVRPLRPRRPRKGDTRPSGE